MAGAPPADGPAQRAVAHVAALSSGPPVDPTWRITLNFHPDRSFRCRTVLSALAADGVYVSQFVTGTGNGGLTARPGGDRWRWESRLFGGAYDDATAHERPEHDEQDLKRVWHYVARFGVTSGASAVL